MERRRSMKIYDVTRDLSGDTIIYPGDIQAPVP